jgi:hypothetical protein
MIHILGDIQNGLQSLMKHKQSKRHRMKIIYGLFILLLLVSCADNNLYTITIINDSSYRIRCTFDNVDYKITVNKSEQEECQLTLDEWTWHLEQYDISWTVYDSGTIDIQNDMRLICTDSNGVWFND